MAVNKETDLGTITISNSVIAQIIFDGMMQPGCRNRIWPATPRGRQIGILEKFTDTEFSMYISVQHSEDHRIMLEFSVICQFGISIKRTTRILADYIAEQFEYLGGSMPAQITVNIAGVRSRQKARRSTKVVYRYETNG